MDITNVWGINYNMVSDILNIVNLGSVAVNTTGSGVDISRIARTTIFSSILTDLSGAATTDLTFNVDVSSNNSEWGTLDTKTYASGTAIQQDVWSYNSNFPWIRTATTNSSGTNTVVSTVVTGRGV